MFSFRDGVLLLCIFLKFGRGQNIPSVNQNQFSKLLEFVKLQVQIEKISDTLHKECPTLFQHPDVSGFLKPVIGKRQLYYGASWEHLGVRISLAEHTLDFLTQSYLKCKGGPLKVTTQAPDPCYSRPCHNNGTCSTNGNSVTCACLPGFTGTTCDVEINECSSQPCQRGETCVDLVNGYRCICQVGHDGKQCTLKVVDHCRSQPCQNGATCVNGTTTYSCICPRTHSGRNCEKHIDGCISSPCPSGATCQNRHGHFECVCPAGFAGNLCQYEISECASRPCQRGGTCVDLVNGYRCICPVGHYGKHCEVVDHCRSQPCQNGATCANGTTTYNCICPKAYSGRNCEKLVDHCRSQPCQNGATCVNRNTTFNCICPKTHTGVNCEKNITECASAPCANGAKCIDQPGSFQCVCPAGFTGTLCENDIDDCISNPCPNGATCIDRHGHFECVCPAGFAGNLCQHEINECSSRPCQRGGTCVDLKQGYRCICPDGHYGKQCEVVDHCRSQPCQNGATCVDGNTTYSCICPQEYTGENCENWTKCLAGGTLSIGNASLTLELDSVKYTPSAWMKDSQPIDPIHANTVWFFQGYDGKTVVTYDSVEAMKNQYVAASTTLPHTWAGTGHVMYRDNLYYQSYGTNNIVKYNFQNNIAVEKQIEGLSSNSGISCQYFHDYYSYSDFAADEYGLWLVYGNVTNNCRLVIAKINPDTLDVEKSWTTSIYSKSVGNTFMKCGVLYGTYYNRDYIRYTYDTNTGEQVALPPNKIRFEPPGKYSHSLVMLDYNPHDGFLYYADYSYGFLATYPLTYSV